MATINKIKVRGMQSLRGYNTIANQYEIETPEGFYFQSYLTVIAFKPFNAEDAFYKLHPGRSLNDEGLKTYPEIYLDRDKWDYSVTTGRYRNQFLGENKAETERKIKSGEYKLVELN